MGRNKVGEGGDFSKFEGEVPFNGFEFVEGVGSEGELVVGSEGDDEEDEHGDEVEDLVGGEEDDGVDDFGDFFGGFEF